MDLRDLWRPGGGTTRLTYRQVASWLERLPGEGAYKTALRDSLTDEQLLELSKRERHGHGPWSHTDLLLAHLADLLNWVIYVVLAVNSAKGKKPKQPKPYPRPGIPRERVATVTKTLNAAQRAYLERVHRGH